VLGFITDADLEQADLEFPGIARFFATLTVKPRTFLELVARFEHSRAARPRVGDAAEPE